MNHDPLCQQPYRQRATCRDCQLIARARADERERLDFCCPPADKIKADLRAQIATDIEAMHSEYDPSGSGDRWHQCDSANMHDALERAARIARGDS